MRGGTFAVCGAVALLACLVRAAAAAPGTPSVTSLSPARGGVGTVVTVSGRNLGTATAVTFAGTSASFAVASATKLTATVPAGAATGHVAVTTPAGTGTSKVSFTVVPAPAVSGFTPTGGTPGTRVTISGADFTGASLVTLGGVKASFSIRSATTITATVPANAVTGTVAVKTVGGTGTSGGTFTVVPLPPKITSFSPVKAGTGMSITVAGSHLGTATTVTVGGASAAFTVLSDAKLSVTIPSASGSISVTTPGGTATSRGSFTLLPTPQIDSLSPTSAVAGTRVTITGSSLTGATLVAFDGTKASFTRKNDTTIVATVPAKAASGAVTVTTLGGVATSGDGFTVIPPAPRINSFAPATGAVGTAVTITGSHLSGTTDVAFGGVASSDVTVVSDAKVTAVVPDAAANGTISVTTPGGTATSRASFTVAPGHTGSPPGTELWSADEFVESGQVGWAVAFSPDGSTVFDVGVGTGNPDSTYETIAYDRATGAKLWSAAVDVPGESGTMPYQPSIGVTHSGAEVIATGESPGDHDATWMVAYDARTGTQLWRDDGSWGAWGETRLALSTDGTRAFIMGAQQLLAFSTATGSQVWDDDLTDTGPILAGSIIATPDDRLIVQGSGSTPGLYAFSAVTGGALWSVDNAPQSSDYPSWQQLALSHDGTIVYDLGLTPDDGTELAAYDTSDGGRRWLTPIDGYWPIGLAATSSGKLVATVQAPFATDGSKDAPPRVLGFSAADGSSLWAKDYFSNTTDDTSAYLGSPVASPDGTTVYVTGFAYVGLSLIGETVAYETSVGTQSWIDDEQYDSPFSLALTPDGATLAAVGGGVRGQLLLAYSG